MNNKKMELVLILMNVKLELQLVATIVPIL